MSKRTKSVWVRDPPSPGPHRGNKTPRLDLDATVKVWFWRSAGNNGSHAPRCFGHCCHHLIARADQATMSSNIPRRAGSIVEVLRHRAHHQGEQLAYTFLRDGEALEEPMSYGSLDQPRPHPRRVSSGSGATGRARPDRAPARARLHRCAVRLLLRPTGCGAELPAAGTASGGHALGHRPGLQRGVDPHRCELGARRRRPAH